MRKETKNKILNALSVIKETALEALYPRVCPLCGEILTDKIRYGENPYICRYCYKKLDFIKGPRCMLCSRPVNSEVDEFCEGCKRRRRFFDGGFGMLLHDRNAKAIIYPIKYKNRKDNADFLAAEAALRFGQWILSWEIDAVVPVPLHKKRLKERGYNQAEIFAERLLENAGIDRAILMPYLLYRAKKTTAMKKLDADARKLNVKDAFFADPEGVRGKRILLIDDIYTSGATISECSKVLKGAGASAVYFLTMSIVSKF